MPPHTEGPWEFVHDQAYKILTVAEVYIGTRPITRDEVVSRIQDGVKWMNDHRQSTSHQIEQFRFERLPDDGLSIMATVGIVALHK